MGCGSPRGELDGTHLEMVAKNFRNPYELCVSSFGESYLSDNDNDGNQSVRICWLLEGGNYGWFGHPPGRVPRETPFGQHWHFRGHVPGYVPANLVTGFGSPCGICFYEGDALGPRFKNAPLHADAGPREVRHYHYEKSGAGMRADSEVIVSSKEDKYFRPDDICTAPDGSVYISDWYDGGVGGHAYNNPDQGRIFLLRPAGKKLTRTGKPGPYASAGDAIEGLKNPNLATQFLARAAIGRRAGIGRGTFGTLGRRRSEFPRPGAMGAGPHRGRRAAKGRGRAGESFRACPGAGRAYPAASWRRISATDHGPGR